MLKNFLLGFSAFVFAFVFFGVIVLTESQNDCLYYTQSELRKILNFCKKQDGPVTELCFEFCILKRLHLIDKNGFFEKDLILLNEKSPLDKRLAAIRECGDMIVHNCGTAKKVFACIAKYNTWDLKLGKFILKAAPPQAELAAVKAKYGIA